MRYVECPNVYCENENSVFIAGGISNCPDWQSELVKRLKNTDLTIINPRRKDFSIKNREMEEEQIRWEFDHLNKAKTVSFWFPYETLCPITLYELGKQSVVDKPIFIGVHPKYSRKRDLEIQTGIIRPEVKIVYSIEKLANQIKEWSKGR